MRLINRIRPSPAGGAVRGHCLPPRALRHGLEVFTLERATPSAVGNFPSPFPFSSTSSDMRPCPVAVETAVQRDVEGDAP